MFYYWKLNYLYLDFSDIPTSVGGSIPVTPEELKSLQYEPKECEWPSGDRDAECDRITRGLEQIMELAMAEYFSAPVDLSAFPSYAMVIEYPMDNLSHCKRGICVKNDGADLLFRCSFV